MAVEAVPVISAGSVVPGPIGDLEVFEYDPGVLVLLVGLGPDVEVARGALRSGRPRPLKPGMLVRCVVADQLGDHPKSPPVCLFDQEPDVAQLPVDPVDVGVVGDVVAIVTKR